MLLVTLALAAPLLELPPGEDAASWSTSAELAGLDLVSGAPRIQVRDTGAVWEIRVADGPPVPVSRPVDEAGRERVAALARSLSRAGVTAPGDPPATATLAAPPAAHPPAPSTTATSPTATSSRSPNPSATATLAAPPAVHPAAPSPTATSPTPTSPTAASPTRRARSKATHDTDATVAEPQPVALTASGSGAEPSVAVDPATVAAKPAVVAAVAADPATASGSPAEPVVAPDVAERSGARSAASLLLRAGGQVQLRPGTTVDDGATVGAGVRDRGCRRRAG